MTTRTWDTTIPADTGYAGDGDDRIRDTKVDLKERLELDHYMDGELDPLEGDCDGYHRKATLYAQATDPTPLTGTGVIYTKVIDGVTELFFRDATTGTINQLTENGVLSLNTLANDIDADGHGITGADIIESDVVTAGTLNVTTIAKTGTGVVTNLNADMVDGKHVQTTLSDTDSYVPTSGAVYYWVGLHKDDTTTHGASGAVVGTTNTQTLSNKTLNDTNVIDFRCIHLRTITADNTQDDDVYDNNYPYIEANMYFRAAGVWRRGSTTLWIYQFKRFVIDGQTSRFTLYGVDMSSGALDTINIMNGGSTGNYGYIRIYNNL